MREIKFRAWRKEEKRMIYLANNMGSQTHLQLNNHSWGVFEPDSDDYYGIASANSNLGDILMQYTGLKDKNCTEIYEGDIVKFEDVGEEGYEYKEGFDFTNYASVEFDNGRWELNNFLDNNSGILETMNSCHEDFINEFELFEVIGNIYENPELLEGRE